MTASQITISAMVMPMRTTGLRLARTSLGVYGLDSQTFRFLDGITNTS